MKPNPSRRKKWLKTAVKLAIVAVVLAAVWQTIVKGVDQLDEHPWQFDFRWLVAAGVLYLLGLLPAGLFWHRTLRAMGQDARLGETLRAYYIGHLGKYVPGKAMVVVIRAGLIHGDRVTTGAAAVSVFFETLTMMAVGAFLSAAIIAASFPQHTLLFWVAIGLMLTAGLPTIPPIFRRLARAAGVGKSDPSTKERLQRLGYGTLLIGWASMTVGWLLLGLSLWAVLRAMGVPDIDLATQWHLYTAGVALAMVAGFLSLIPGGAVVREAVLMGLLAAKLGADGETIALVSAIALRIVWLTAELALSAVLYFAPIGPKRQVG